MKKIGMLTIAIGILLSVFHILLLSGCGRFEKIKANVVGSSEIVVDGVVYLQFPSGVTVKYNRDGSIVTRN